MFEGTEIINSQSSIFSKWLQETSFVPATMKVFKFSNLGNSNLRLNVFESELCKVFSLEHYFRNGYVQCIS